MKTIDTTKLWTVHPATDTTHPEICGPGGISMDVYDATTEQAQEIADTLNGATASGMYSVTARAGDVEITYSAPAADEVMWMYRQSETRTEGEPTPIMFNINELRLPQRVEREPESGTLQPVFDEASEFTQVTRQPGKSTAALAVAYARIAELSRIAESTEKRLSEALARRESLRRLLNEHEQTLVNYENSLKWCQDQMDRCAATLEKATGNLVRRADIANVLENFSAIAYQQGTRAAVFARDATYYRGLLDRCSRAIGKEAFTADDGSVSDTPVRAKVAELVEQMCLDAAGHKDALDRAVKEGMDAVFNSISVRHMDDALLSQERWDLTFKFKTEGDLQAAYSEWVALKRLIREHQQEVTK